MSATTPAPYYEDTLVTIYHGDCREILPALADSSVASVLTDPPYSAHVHSNSRSGRMESANAEGGRYGADTRRNVDLGFAALASEDRAFCASEFARLSSRWVLAFSDVEMCHEWRDDLKLAGLDYVRTGAWIKVGGTPQFSGDRPAVGFEAITIAHAKGRKRWNGGGTHGVWSFPIVLDRGKAGLRLHTTQKPLQLMSSLVALFTDAGETILDPFAGSGTTLRAAKDHGRRAIGIEQEEHYCEVAARRLGQEVLDMGAA